MTQLGHALVPYISPAFDTARYNQACSASPGSEATLCFWDFPTAVAVDLGERSQLFSERLRAGSSHGSFHTQFLTMITMDAYLSSCALSQCPRSSGKYDAGNELEVPLYHCSPHQKCRHHQRRCCTSSPQVSSKSITQSSSSLIGTAGTLSRLFNVHVGVAVQQRSDMFLPSA